MKAYGITFWFAHHFNRATSQGLSCITWRSNLSPVNQSAFISSKAEAQHTRDLLLLATTGTLHIGRHYDVARRFAWLCLCDLLAWLLIEKQFVKARSLARGSRGMYLIEHHLPA